MKANKKVILTTATVLGAAALVAGGTIAYFTDKDTKTNSFTVGNVDITLYESQLHRMNSGRQGSFGALASDPNYCDWNANPNDVGLDSNTGLIKGSYEKAKYCTPGMNANEGDNTTISALANGHYKHASRTWGYKDSTIIADAATYKSAGGYFETVAGDIVPGQWIRKFSYVVNNNTDGHGTDAYVMISYKVPKNINDKITINMPSSGYFEDSDTTTPEIDPYFTLVEKVNGQYVPAASVTDSSALKTYKGYLEDNYMVYTAVVNVALKPGEMTFWSPVNTIKLNDNTQNNDSTATATYVAPGSLFDIVVEAQGVQARTFSNALEAFNALQN